MSMNLFDARIYGDIVHLPLEKIQAGNNDRTQFNQAELEELADSIQQHGLLQPITVRPTDNGYEIVAGERRYRAYGLLHAKTGQFDTIPAMIKELSDRQADAFMLLENMKRANLNPLDEANAYHKRMTRWGLTVQEIASESSVSVQTVKGRLELLALRDDIQHLIKSGNMPLNFAACLKGLDHNFQLIALRYFQETTRPTVQAFKKICVTLLEKQNQAELFDWDSFMVAPIEPEPVSSPVDPVPTVDSNPKPEIIQEALPGMLYAPRSLKHHKPRHIVPAGMRQQVALFALVTVLTIAPMKV